MAVTDAPEKNYVVYHLHSDLSNCVTNIDSITKYGEYIERAKVCGMKAMAFSEHGSIMEWWHKKCAIEAAGMKYIHAIEAYLTETLTEKIRDNYHCVLIAKNYAGFLELNRLVSRSFFRSDNHFYYTPRITFDELFATSDNILVTTACVGGVFGKGSEEVQQKFLRFMDQNRGRCFFEIGHHRDSKQVEYNKMMWDLSQQHGIRLIAGTDTHVLNEEHERGRRILQAAKNIHFDGEDNWDLKFKTYDELVAAFQEQNSLPEEVFLEAIENTNLMASMIEEFKIDCGTKYPHIYDNPERIFREKIQNAIETHPYALKNHSRKELQDRVDQEFEVYKTTGSIDFMLMQTYLREWEKEHGIQCGYGRGSVSGSMIAYLLGITQMDSLRFGLNFFRFMNPDRVSNADIDSDYSEQDRAAVKEFLLKDKMNLPQIRSAEIITFNTIAMKGAVRDVCRALYKDSETVNYLLLSKEISDGLESDEAGLRRKYPEVFEYADIVNGTIVSIGTHPSGVLVSDLPIDEVVGLCSISTSDYPVSMLNMKELDDQFFVKLDILGLDSIGIINDTCKELGIERLTPDSVDLQDVNVWRDIRDNTTMIFQWESNSAQQFLKRFMSYATIEIAKKKIPNFSMIKWMSFGNGLIRPACASFRDSVAAGEFYDNGFDALNEFLAPEAGRIAMQETIMMFLVKFCGYSMAESDTVRRAIAKKKGTEQLLPEIEQRFVDYCAPKYNMTRGRCEEIIKPFIQIILDASAYGFSWNHSDAYSCTGYISGYLRYYHPIEFLTAALNTFEDDLDKTANITSYAGKVGITVMPPRWGLSRGKYVGDAEKKIIAKGITSIKYMNESVADELYNLARSRDYSHFVDLLRDVSQNTSVNSRQIDTLIKVDFFADFGNQRELFRIVELFELFKKGEAKQIKRSLVDGTEMETAVSRNAIGTTKSGSIAKSYTLLDVMAILRELEDRVKEVGMEDLPMTIKVKNFADVTGVAGYVTNEEKDRSTLYIREMYPRRRKKDGSLYGYSFLTKSVGSGREANFTVFKKVYDQEPVQKGDLIKCLGWAPDGRNFIMQKYIKVF